MYNENQAEMFILFLGDLCDSPDSLRYHIAKACDSIEKKRKKEGKTYPKSQGYWKPFLPSDKTSSNR